MTAKRWLLLACILIMAAIAVLAASLHDVRFEPATPLSFDEEPAPPTPSGGFSEAITQIPLWKLLFFWAAFAINLILFLWLLPPEQRKRLLRQMLTFALSILGILIALRYKLINLPFLEGEPAQNENPVAAGSGSGTPIPTFTPPHMAPWWVFLSSFVVLALVLAGLWWAYRWWMRQGSGASGLDAIGSIAASSLSEIQSGRDWSDVIIRSYARMNEAVFSTRGLQRPRSATPREFAERLEQSGLPAHAIARLTRLFESARYGAGTSSQAEINEAVACLNSILQACGQAQ